MLEISRLVEFFSVAFLVTAGLFSPLITLILIASLIWWCSARLTLLIVLLYGGWLWIDRRIEARGGRWSERLRRLTIWTYFTRYFPIELVKTVDLDRKRNYIFGYHPHGAFCLGAVSNFCTEATHFSKIFPGIRPHMMLIRLQFLFPFTRDIFLRLGKGKTFW